MLWLQASPVTFEERRLYNLPFLFYLTPNLCRSPEIVMGKSLAPVSLLTKNHKKIMKLIKSSQHKPIQILLNRGSKIQENFLTFAETHSYVVYGWASVLSYGQHSLSSAGESDCNYQSNKYEFPSQIIFHFSWQ